MNGITCQAGSVRGGHFLRRHQFEVRTKNDPNSLEGYFTGKEVVLKIDMPGTQQGVDLRYNKERPHELEGVLQTSQEQRGGNPQRSHCKGYSGRGQG